MPRNIVIGQSIDPAKAQRAKELRRDMTAAERRLWERLRGSRLNGWHFRRQQVIAGFIVDFYCHAAGLVVEVDGEVHLQQAAEDTARDGALSERGLAVLRLRNEQALDDIEGVLEQIHRSCLKIPPPK